MIPDRVTGRGKKYSWKTDQSVEDVAKYFSNETFLEDDSSIESLYEGRDYHVNISGSPGRTEIQVIYQGEETPNDVIMENWKEQTSEFDQEKRSQENSLASHFL